MKNLLEKLWDDEGQDIAEYAVMLALILVLVIGTARLIGTRANNAFSSVASSPRQLWLSETLPRSKDKAACACHSLKIYFFR